MKILQVHNEYQQRGGEDTVLDFEKALLSKSHTVVQYIVSNHTINSFFSKLRLLWSTHYSRSSYKKFTLLLKKEQPDIVHVHNFFPLISPSIFKACLDSNVPVVMTLHNYRLIHPGGLLLNGNTIDERSIKGSAYLCVKDAVYRDSVLQTLVVAHMIEYHRRKGTWNNQVDRFIALTEFAKSKFVEGGLPEEKVVVKPNFLLEANRKPPVARLDQFVFVGRLSSEKGIGTLLKAWESIESHDLVIVGDGPLASAVKSAAQKNKKIIWKGSLPHDQVLKEVSSSRGLIFPSEWYEGFPMVLVESLACGTPVISSNIGSQQEIIKEGICGLHFEVKNEESLVQQVEKLAADDKLFDVLSQNGLLQYENLYSQEKNLKTLENIYDDAIAQKIALGKRNKTK
jgi:glycosyltransferase involved in cell wall biosynthesis